MQEQLKVKNPHYRCFGLRFANIRRADIALIKRGRFDVCVGRFYVFVCLFDALVGLFYARVGRLDARVGRLDARVGRLDARVGRLDVKVGRLDVKVGRLDVKVGRLEAGVGRYFVGRGLLEGLYAYGKGSISVLKTFLDACKEKGIYFIGNVRGREYFVGRMTT